MKIMMSQKLQNALPQPFPPSWADSWGEDEYGLYADLNVSIPVQQLSDFNNTFKALLQDSEKKKGKSIKAIIQRFRWIAAGDFLMGSPKSGLERFEREDQHRVTLTQGYWLADTAVTQEFWQLVMSQNPAKFNGDVLSPVEEISWNDSNDFINKLNDMHAGTLDDLVIRLPTEAEWEHACRAGTTKSFSFGDNVTSEQVNFKGSHPYNNGKKSEVRSKTVAVKCLPPNSWGLYEMHGNVWEWCVDEWQESLGTQPMVDPCPSYDRSAGCVVRGGSWIDRGRSVRSAFRDRIAPTDRGPYIGLRLTLGHELNARSAK